MFEHIMSTFYGSFWAILPERLDEIQLAMHARIMDGPAIVMQPPGQPVDEERFRAEFNKQYSNGLATRGTIATLPEYASSRQPAYHVANSVAILPIHGTIYPRGGMNPMSGGTTAERIASSIKAAANDKAVSSIVLDIDSPGGAVAGVMEAADAIHAATMQKPIHAVANHLAASAGYWLATQATTLTATPSARVGNIGVIRMHMDKTAMLANKGVKVTEIATAKYKTEGTPYAPLADESLSHYLGEAQQIHQQFTTAVARGRNTTAENVDKNFGEGRVVMASAAKMLGMVDRIATLEQVISSAREIASMKGRMQARMALASM